MRDRTYRSPSIAEVRHMRMARLKSTAHRLGIANPSYYTKPELLARVEATLHRLSSEDS